MRNLLILIISVGFCWSFNAGAEGLPANPWAQRQSLTVGKSNQVKAEELTEQTVNAAVDMWSKVRNSEEFRQWKMPEQAKAEAEKQKSSETNQQNLLTMLSNLNRVGYKVPSDYRNIVKKSTAKNNNVSYEQMLKEWQLKYQNTKNSTMNIVGRSYDKMLFSIKRSTGIDVNRTINDAVNAFK